MSDDRGAAPKPEHVLVSVTMRKNSWEAKCRCGRSSVAYNRSKAVAMLYSHVIHASKPECPTPHKKKHGTRGEAENAIRRYLARARPGDRPARAYRCPSGQHWHTTKSAAPERKAA
ncbi:hypothetical protein [Nocardia farcinica]|uniref:Uncharacterized protein n=1 Tax=Nocardia farcinica (strain IFM 10152) TaxID=247156 RepID=Q5YSL9_NOCFA|nr:hypothetical protein [Nocardia farcinica]BAD58822.1 hypothetical protein NFA_39740 [Nocardia farcinica IFM 10152]